MRRFTITAALLAAAVVLLFNLHGWLLLARTSQALEAELGARLRAVAVTLAAAAEGCDPTAAAGLLETVRAENDLFAALIVNESLAVIAATGGGSRVAPEADAAAILAAFSGEPTESPVHAAGRYRLKSAYAPLYDSLGLPSAVVGVEADAGFFAALGDLRRGLIAANVASAAILAAIVLISAALARRALALEQAAGRAGSLALIGRLSAAVAHDVRNPLGIIRAAAERLRRRHGDEPETGYITAEVDRLNRLITGYLNLGATRPGEPEEIDLPALAEEAVRDLDHETRGRGIAVTVTAESPPPVRSGRIELRQALLNLLLNAIQAQPGGGSIAVRVTAERRRGRQWAALSVADSGPGIAARDRRRVFEPFYTTREKGSGLGLFSVKRIVEAQGGRVDVDSTPGRGTTFTIRLPA